MFMSVTDENTIDQRSIIRGPMFQFNKDYLGYFGIEFDFKVRYADIAGPSQYRRIKTPDRLTSFALLFFSALAVELLLLHSGDYPQYGAEAWRAAGVICGTFLGIAGAICGTIYFITHKEYTVIPTRNGNILVVT
jgi:hypothetical protein